MDQKEILSHVDHTQLKAFATWEDIQKLCEEAIEYQTASVCIPPCYIKRVHDTYGEKINICTVVGFPLGYSVTEAKAAETKKALEDGASEVDMVVNISDVKNGNYDAVQAEIAALKKITGDKILKVIIETCYLTEEEKIAMCKAVTEAGADYIKTSTGFGTAGATLEDIRLFRENIGQDVKMKAAGGVKTVADMEAFLEAGCDRIGTSSAIKLIHGCRRSRILCKLIICRLLHLGINGHTHVFSILCRLICQRLDRISRFVCNNDPCAVHRTKLFLISLLQA